MAGSSAEITPMSSAHSPTRALKSSSEIGAGAPRFGSGVVSSWRKGQRGAVPGGPGVGGAGRGFPGAGNGNGQSRAEGGRRETAMTRRLPRPRGRGRHAAPGAAEHGVEDG